MATISKDPKGRLYSDYTHEEYHEILPEEAVGASQLKAFLKHEKYMYVKSSPTDSMILGTAFEDYLYYKLGINNDFFKKYFDFRDYIRPTKFRNFETNEDFSLWEFLKLKDASPFLKKNADGKLSKYQINDKTKLIADNNYRFPLMYKELRVLDIMFQKFILLQPFHNIGYADLITKSDTRIEEIIVWERNGVTKKCKPDLIIIHEDRVYYDDIKTTSSPVIEFNTAVSRYQYWMQAIHTKEGIEKLYPQYEVNRCRYPIVGTSYPILSKIWDYDDCDNYSVFEQYYESVINDFKDFLSRKDLGLDKDYDDARGKIQLSAYGLDF